MEFPKMARTSSSFLAFPVTKVTGRDRTNPLAAAISQISFAFSGIKSLNSEKIRETHYKKYISFPIFLHEHDKSEVELKLINGYKCKSNHKKRKKNKSFGSFLFYFCKAYG
ncbi:hypothetical protein V8G54_029586 [Vigna mungo]|uniref:Uncharacterized protein n=1 Tax=Vigna mungo TaxID=3915 RepID=A0AAQ3RMS3_VIGMU